MTRLKKTWLVIFIIAVAGFCVYYIYKSQAKDTTPPEIVMEEETIRIPVDADEATLLEGVTASDDTDGDVTATLLVDSMSDLFVKNGKNMRTVTYAAYDSSYNVARAERTIVYKNYESPWFEQTGSLRFTVGSSIDLESLMTAQDCFGNDLTTSIIISDEEGLTNQETGSYLVEYRVTDSAGVTSTLPVEIEVYEFEYGMMVMELSDYLIYMEAGSVPFDSTDGAQEDDDAGADGAQAEDDTGAVQQASDGAADYYRDFVRRFSYSSKKFDVVDESPYADTEEDSGDYVLRSMIEVDDSEVDYDTAGTYSVRLSYSSLSSVYSGTETITVVIR